MGEADCRIDCTGRDEAAMYMLMAFIAVKAGEDFICPLVNDLIQIVAVTEERSCHRNQIAFAFRKKFFIHFRIVKAAIGSGQDLNTGLFDCFCKF